MLSCLTENISLPITQGSKVIIQTRSDQMKMALEDLEPGKLVKVKEINGFQEKIPFQYHERGYYITRIPTSLSSKNAIEVLAGMVMVVEDVYAIVKKPPTANKTIIL